MRRDEESVIQRAYQRRFGSQLDTYPIYDNEDIDLHVLRVCQNSSVVTADDWDTTKIIRHVSRQES